MRVDIALETRFERTPDGRVWSASWLDASFWDRFLEVFDEVRVVARLRDVAEPPASAKPADKTGVRFFAVPYYIGPWDYLRKRGAIRRVLRSAVEPGDALIVRAPGALSEGLTSPAIKAHRPYGIEVVGDPAAVFAPGAVRSIFSPILRYTAPRALRRQCAHAAAATYVTTGALQRLYPSRPDAFSNAYSDVELPDEAFVSSPNLRHERQASTQDEPLRLVSVAALEQYYKGTDVLIEAVAQLTAWKLNVQVALVGDGRLRTEFEGLSRSRGVDHCVEFLGHVPPGQPVRSHLDRAHVFVLPSRTEGLPRALIEAMARGLPCVGSRVGGIPELLDETELVPPDNAAQLAETLRDLIQDPARRARLAEANLRKARAFHVDIMRARRREFYFAVRDKTQAWIRSRSQHRADVPT